MMLGCCSSQCSFSSQIFVALADGVEEMEAVMIIDILRRAKANVVAVSIEDKLEVLASRKTKLVADMLFEDAAKLQFDLILLPVSHLSLHGCQEHAEPSSLLPIIPSSGFRVGSAAPGRLQAQTTW